jgi:hypothetical protein
MIQTAPMILMKMSQFTEKGATRLIIRSGVLMIRKTLNVIGGHVDASLA